MRLPGLFIAGEKGRAGATSRLAERLEFFKFFGIGGMFSGSAGTGGATSTPDRDGGRPGDGLRNVRSVIEPELFCLSNVFLPLPLGAFDREALDDLLCMRLVWI